MLPTVTVTPVFAVDPETGEITIGAKIGGLTGPNDVALAAEYAIAAIKANALTGNLQAAIDEIKDRGQLALAEIQAVRVSMGLPPPSEG